MLNSFKITIIECLQLFTSLLLLSIFSCAQRGSSRERKSQRGNSDISVSQTQVSERPSERDQKRSETGLNPNVPWPKAPSKRKAGNGDKVRAIRFTAHAHHHCSTGKSFKKRSTAFQFD
ncbi:uncharacterized protein CELE_H12D21.2 [Caenorhabditis elegans]|uniref:Secreted protein n=1 Tax=Caenorhabditis elegans TaxID=6239 RepID=H2L2K1_CAEEL|nr:Secreted protein [Caenorhabditis elegans]CCE71471.1 Secreted protein [Caenorhabditis elegans]|eukprot:NP_001256629.1 Uncharacterized protein CELE_H12D21.2 [Caenorhabditis elegans]